MQLIRNRIGSHVITNINLHRVTLAVEFDSPFATIAEIEAIARCSSVTCLVQLAMDFFPTLRDKLHGKLHRFKMSSKLRKFEFKVFSMVCLNDHDF